jgi:hypothetical protein
MPPGIIVYVEQVGNKRCKSFYNRNFEINITEINLISTGNRPVRSTTSAIARNPGFNGGFLWSLQVKGKDSRYLFSPFDSAGLSGR